MARLLQCYRKPAKGLKLMKGDNWFSITDKLARYIVENASFDTVGFLGFYVR